jgi:glycosyltransferase involved in cell wall biosynthesis
VSPRVASVATVHDLIWMRDPETMGLRGRLGMGAAVRVSARASDRLIAVSHAARADLVRTLAVDPGRVDVVHHGVRVDGSIAPASELRVRERFELGERPVVLCIAQFRSHKNLARLVEAHARLANPEAALLLVGPRTPQAAELEALAARLGTANRVRVTGWVSDADLEGLYRMATCFVLPSLEEGFGLPVLEAMARKVPVACSDATSLPEVAGDAALLFDPYDTAAIARALDRLLADAALRASLAGLGAARAREFTWEAAARATIESYRRALAA